MAKKSKKTQEYIEKRIRELSLQGEVFRPLPFSELHYVSNYGRCYGVWQDKIIDQDLESGYARLYIRSNEDNKYHHYQVHRLVCMLFVPGFTKDKKVHHVDRDKLNNCAWNVTPVTPIQHQIIHSKEKESRKLRETT